MIDFRRVPTTSIERIQSIEVSSLKYLKPDIATIKFYYSIVIPVVCSADEQSRDYIVITTCLGLSLTETSVLLRFAARERLIREFGGRW